MKLFLLLGCFCFISLGFSQATISGSLKTQLDQPISAASITLTELNTDNIISYDITDDKGFFSISLSSQLKKIQLNIRSMGYKTVVKTIDNKTQTINFVLEEEITKLKEVLVKSTPITRKGDTINYSVSAFTKQQDRTIADVLKNIPGIEVLSDGKIFYQGKPINKYYIEGLDLLEGKYNLANNNLPHKEVSKIQVLENHQPIKLLDSLVFSDQAALNIKLKNSFTFTGQAKLGSGFSPLLWDANITPILLSKKKQMLNSYQANNTGNNVASQLKTLTFEDFIDRFERNDQKQDWLAIQKLNVPNFAEQRWLDNNIHLITTNYLQTLKNDYELRLNASYINDYQQQSGSTNTQFFTANDTIALFENNNNQFYINTLETNLTLQKNTKKKFFKNSLKFQGFWDSQRGNIQLNTNTVNQNLNNRYFKLSNDLKTLFPLGKQIATLKSYIGYSKTPQSLTVNPGQFNAILNNGNPFDEVTQDIELNTFYTNNTLGFTKGWKQFSFSPKIGFQFEKQDLQSTIFTPNTNETLNLENNLDWTRSKLYVNLKTQYKKEKWRLELTTPINLHNYQLEDAPLQERQNLNRVTFEPRVSINYDLNSFWSIRGSANLNNQFGTINQVYYNYILLNYRNIRRIDAPLPQLQNFSYSGSISYRNPVNALFFNLIYNNTTTDNNLLYNNQILDNGATELQAIEQDNKRFRHSISTRVSKYFSDFNTNLTLSANYSLQDLEQIINSEITDITNENWSLNGKVDVDINDWLNTELESTFQFSNNEIQGQENQTITQQFHKFNINIYPKDNQFLGLKTEYIKNDLFSENTENFFADLVYRFTWSKKNIDFELQWNNIFNTENYRTITINNFRYLETNFRLRPSQVLFKISFSL
ncbi:TonB-dependent receptor [Winogradskyella immobilis]|uniref:Carboxypeptidase-like regulatory domain-containing protein n=1 Tax=Winogradskyella immobilis TaxID=2816852 RepID=A0ABS8EQB2_9FLAO|nr:carboxypeptidase-like regulatory domain-containing protein [Winogradskyella immobilis]MCC1485196.1 carboxypeptidase-like regulatory domain-containing protein [Winogradskyella immobilis]MCG0017288.1 carboxypeptidase-like regulatory domain-containing protein [Winogradskyella immobilis]